MATQAASHLLITEINGESARRHIAAYLLNAVALSVLDRTLSSGDIDAIQLADAPRHHGRGSEALRGREAVMGRPALAAAGLRAAENAKLSAASR